MTTYSTFFLPHDGFTPGPGVKRKSEKLGNSETIEAAGDVIFADVARRTNTDVDVVERVLVAFCQYQIFPSNGAATMDAGAKAKLALVTCAMGARLGL